MGILNAEEVKELIGEVVRGHFEDWGQDPDNDEAAAKVSALCDDIYILFNDLINESEEEPEDDPS